MSKIQDKSMIRAARRIARRAGMSNQSIRCLHIRSCTVNGISPTFGMWAVSNRQKRIFDGCKEGILKAMKSAWLASGGRMAFYGCPFEGINGVFK